MQGFNTVYTKYFNASHNTIGYVLRRYKALVVDKDHFSEMTRFIHLRRRARALRKPWRYHGPATAYVGPTSMSSLWTLIRPWPSSARFTQQWSDTAVHQDRLKSVSHCCRWPGPGCGQRGVCRALRS